MKKFLSLLLALAMVMGLLACGAKPEAAPEAAPETQPATEPTEAPAAQPAPQPHQKPAGYSLTTLIIVFAAGALIGAAIVAIIKFRKKKLFDSSL